MHDPTLFETALNQATPAERAAYLDRVCAGNPEQRRELEALLAAHDAAGGFLERPAVEQLGGSVPATQIRSSLPEAKTVAGDLVGLEFLAPATRPDSLGRLGHYHILAVVGQGGMGTVFKAFDEQLHRIVAIKVISGELAAHATARRRFIREARAAAAVAHEHVVTIHAVDEEHRPPFIVMQYVEGCSLQEKLDRQGPPSLPEILRIGYQIAAGLAAAHKQGLVHRDVKPANILLENGVERVKLTDFGLARIADDASHTQSGVIAGTPQYMSPEQAEGLTVDHRSDLFSLGSVLYVLCTGHPPFRATTTLAVLKRVCEDAPRPIREINPDIPEWLCAIIGRLMAKDPQDRYQTAEEVARLLSEHLAHQQGLAPAPLQSEPVVERVRRTYRWLTSRFSLATTATILFIVVLLVGPTISLRIAGRGRLSFRQSDGTIRLEVYRDGQLIGDYGGFDNVEIAAGTYEFRPVPISGYRFYDMVANRRTWPWSFQHQQWRAPTMTYRIYPGDVIHVLMSVTQEPARPEPPVERESPPVKPLSAEEAAAVQAAYADQHALPVQLTDTLGITLRLIPPGEFEMGATPEELRDLQARLTREKGSDYDKFVVSSSGPRHRVTLTQPFFLGIHEVTVAQFRLFVEESGYRSTMEEQSRPAFTWKTFAANPGVDRRPVVGVSWNDARAFCVWLSEKEGLRYDLPSEAQWEYACRAGSQTLWSFGDEERDLRQYAVFHDGIAKSVADVGSRKPNPWGLFDMHGNIDEWCLDWHQQDYYRVGPAADPICLQEPIQPNSGKVARGGIWSNHPWATHSAIRNFDFARTPLTHKGFRVSIQGDLTRIGNDLRRHLERQKETLPVPAPSPAPAAGPADASRPE